MLKTWQYDSNGTVHITTSGGTKCNLPGIRKWTGPYECFKVAGQAVSRAKIHLY